MSFEISKVDVAARKKAAKQIREVFLKIIKDVEKGKPPTMVIPKRTLSNTVYDNVRKLLLLGEEKLRRELTNMGEAKKFMQTMLMASIIYRALVENEYPTIRDLYYRGKHTIKYIDYKGRLREEETWSEQKESDSVIRDIEVITGLLRENMLILSKEKGKVVGNMRIKSGDDIIDLSKMGHGAYAIESTPDLIEFKDVDAEYVLVVEKDAVFQQLHRIGYWKKHKALLVTSAGQPDRATRRFVRRLHEELKLPVYILTDSDPYGWYIYSVFKIGSITLSYESERLATPPAKFLGVSMTDVFGEEPLLARKDVLA
ncbi:MAG: DNA topoisomerase IV subunit A, partial [Desulfurococcales archaeon]|nr:DNA topoisomerase IV subunit A [Desulfurococcales archaeon]